MVSRKLKAFYRALPRREGGERIAHRLVNSRFPPIHLFDDVADVNEFEALYEIQALTNPRLQNEIGRLEFLDVGDIPFGIPGCSYATAPFTHVNPDGSRFSDGTFGVLYLAESLKTAIAEVKCHQQRYWSNVPDLHYDRFVFRGLTCRFEEGDIVDASGVTASHPVFAVNDYTASRQLGAALKSAGETGIHYPSVRREGGLCWGLLSPRPVKAMVQSAHIEMIWQDGINAVNRLSRPT